MCTCHLRTHLGSSLFSEQSLHSPYITAIVRMLPPNELDEANRVIEGEMNGRFNVTIRWHESHWEGCPHLCGTTAQIAVPQASAQQIHIELDDREAPCLLGSAPVKKMLEMAAVNKIVGPGAPPPLHQHHRQSRSQTNRAAALRHVQNRLRKQ